MKSTLWGVSAEPLAFFILLNINLLRINLESLKRRKDEGFDFTYFFRNETSGSFST